MATEIQGYKGNVSLGSIIQSDVGWNTHQWTINVSGETHDTTRFNTTGWKKFLAGLKGWTGSVEMYIPSDTTLRVMPSDVGQEVTGRFYLDPTTGLTGKAIINSWNPAAAVAGVETQTLGLQGSSDLFPF